jgi:5-deoxy-glucuronate isomerase
VSEPAIAPAAPRNDLPVEDLRLRSDARERVEIDPGRAGWRYLTFRAARVADGESIAVGGPGVETAIVLIAGGDAVLDVHAQAARKARGRTSPFEALPSGWYLPPGVWGELTARGRGANASTLFAIASAPSSRRSGVTDQVVAFGPDDIRVEIRGAGNATRQINHIIAPDFPADRLEVVEVLTPSGNWSSWPPHKHDVDDMPNEAVLEEVYYYRFKRPEAWGVQREYRADRSRDGLWEVRTGDVVLVTDGYHPFTAAHGDDAYYLNALAGDRRTMACSFDPDLDWVRDTWAAMAPDPRLPLVGHRT